MMKHDQASKLDANLAVVLIRFANVLQRQAKSFLFRTRLGRISVARAEARDLIAAGDEMSIRFALEILESLPEDGVCWPETQNAHQALKRIKQEKYAMKALQLAIDAKDIDALQNSIRHASDAGLRVPQLSEAESLLSALLTPPADVPGEETLADGEAPESPPFRGSPNTSGDPRDATSPKDSWPDLESMMVNGDNFSVPVDAAPGDVLRAALAAGELLSSKIDA